MTHVPEGSAWRRQDSCRYDRIDGASVGWVGGNTRPWLAWGPDRHHMTPLLDDRCAYRRWKTAEAAMAAVDREIGLGKRRRP